MNQVKPIHIGMRTFKTALATAFCAFLYYFTDRSPAFACIGVIFGMGANMEDARKNGGNRLFGTIIGGVQPGGVVLCILLFNTPAATYIDYAMNRIFDTAVGVIIALIISYFFPRGWMDRLPARWESTKRHAMDAVRHVRLHHPPKKRRSHH